MVDRNTVFENCVFAFIICFSASCLSYILFWIIRKKLCCVQNKQIMLLHYFDKKKYKSYVPIDNCRVILVQNIHDSIWKFEIYFS